MATMKVLVVLALVAVANANTIAPVPHSAYGYIQNVAIPLAEEIYEAELKAARDPSIRVVGGNVAEIGQFPYQVGLITSFEGMTGRGVCGGSLLSRTIVASAAHCWYDGVNQGSAVEVVLGSVTLFYGGTRFRSTNVIMHRQWDPRSARNDVDVIRLPDSVTLSPTIALISLPSGAELNDNYAGETAVASGFGLVTSNGAIANNQALSFVDLNIITNEVCLQSFPFNLQSTNLCTSGAEGKSTCRGDSGGPLVITRGNRQFLIGITSFGSALGCEAGLPAVFSRVTSFFSFFDQFLR